MIVDEVARRHDMKISKRVFDAKTSKGQIGGNNVICAKPQMYMNRSGYSVGPLFDFYKCEPEDLIVVHDDIDLGVAQLKVTRGAGHGGHNGVRSIVEELGFNDFYRVRVGVGRPPEHMDPADYVLQAFAKEEREQLDELISRSADAVEDLLRKSLSEVQMKYH